MAHKSTSESSQSGRCKKGFALLELLAVLAIILLITSLSYLAFNSLSRAQVLKKDAATLISLLEEARSLTLASKEASQYGVYLSESDNKAALFKGSQYIEGTLGNEEFFFDESVSLSVNLVGGAGSSIVFDRLKGTTEQHGSVIFSLINEATSTLTVAIYPTGVAELLP
ncbi:MAG: hypothetical protein G01um1014107_215 [Parcubacteria group bacterium Gr01-1014_107]|nr:MAG: hypothetical protein G01um1014107_215 [Parcubacteria group bacterium Gr01-1014_107]